MGDVKKLPWKWSDAFPFITPPAALGILGSSERLFSLHFFPGSSRQNINQTEL